MLTLQKSFEFDGPDGTIELEAIVQYPRYATIKTNDTSPSSLVDIGSGTLSFKFSTKDKEYSFAVDTSNIFGDDFGDVVFQYINVLTSSYRKPVIDELSIPLKVSFDKKSSVQTSLDTIFFVKYASYTATPPSIPKFAPSASGQNGVVPSASPSSTFTNAAGPFTRDIGGEVGIPGPKNIPQLPQTSAIVNSNIYWVNKQAYYATLKALFPNVKAEDECVLLYLINQVIDLSGKIPQMSKAGDGQKAILNNILAQFGLSNSDIYAALASRWATLFDWPLKATDPDLLSFAGMMRIHAPEGTEITMQHFNYYHLVAELLEFERSVIPHSKHFTWDQNAALEKDAIKFQFPTYISRRNLNPPVRIRLIGFDGTDQWSENFSVEDEATESLDINVNLYAPPILGGSAGGGVPGKGNKKIKGKLVSLSKSCTLKGSVVLQAKLTNDGEWAVVSSGISDKAGNFALPYPYGPYVAAQALVSLDPASKTTIPTNPSTPNGESLSDAFLYILLNPGPDKASADDCGCNSTITADRLPSQDELIQSNQFTQDLGGGCMNLSTPNRTLREYNYSALVRTTDPDVANYLLHATTQWVNGEEVIRYELELSGKVERKMIDLDNLIKWQDTWEDSLDANVYQAVTVATGHVLTYKSEFRADGYSLGELLHSLPLAPGQKKQIVTIDSTHAFRGSEDQSLTASERLANSLVSEREVVDDIAGNIGEQIRGSSDANTSGISAGAGVSGSYGAGPAKVGATAAVAGGTANANSTANQDSSRALTGHFDENIKQAVQQNATSYRQQNSSIVTTAQEGQNYGAETTVVANHNHCHAITMMHWEVLRHFAVYQELVDVEECVFIPFPLTRFTVANIAKWADTLVQFLRPLRSNTFFRPNGFFGTTPRHPLVPAFDAAERVRTNWALVDYPTSAYDEEPIQYVSGTMTVTVDIPRPQTRYDNIRSLPLITKPGEAKYGALGAFAEWLWGANTTTPVGFASSFT